MQRRILIYLYALEFGLFVTHEVDSAYWQEWKLFGLPGGAGVFALIHLPIVLLFLFGLAELIRGTFDGTFIAWVMALTGIGALFIHGGFILSGHPEFQSPISLGIIGAMAGVGIALAIELVTTALKPAK
jgi:hypothetical protein